MQNRTTQLLEFPKVLGLLAGFCASESGAERCLAIGPVSDRKVLDQRIALLDQWVRWSAETGFKVPAFPGLEGFLAFIRRPMDVIELDALWAVAQVLGHARDVRAAVREVEAERWPLIAEMGGYGWPEKLWPALKRCIGPDGLLKDGASPELFSVRTEIRSIHQRCIKRVKSFVDSEGLSHILQDEFVTVSSDRYVLPLKVNYKRSLKGIIHDYSQTGETCYFEPMFLVDLNNELQELKEEERAAEREVLRYLTGLVKQEEEELREAYDFLVDADVLNAQARFASEFNARAVPVEDGALLSLRNARHPLLVQSGEAIPLDLELLEGQHGLVVSGGNAGGKTVCLKTLGLTAIMAMSALPVCVDEGSTMPPWKKIFVVLGDEQSLEDSLSTFTAQITNLSDAYPMVDADTLVIMDEFGAGTDPGQGAALAQAVVDAMLDRGAWLAAATHFPALKAYALSREGIRAASVLFHPETHKPLYRLAYDQVGASQALDVAREHGLPEEILARAEQYMLLDGSDTSKVVERLNSLAVDREHELEQVRREKEKLHDKRLRFNERYEREKREVLDAIQAKSQSVIKQWQEDKIGRKKALKELADLKKSMASQVPQDQKQATAKPLTIEDFEEGVPVKHLGLGKDGVVAAVNERKKQIKVDLGGVSVWAGIDALSLRKSQKTQKDDSGSAPHVPAGRGVQSMTLDLRGMRSDEAEAELHRFMDGAVLSGKNQLEIIHGRGTGALRSEVHRILKSSSAVASFSLAPEDQGGDGMTIVVLK